MAAASWDRIELCGIPFARATRADIVEHLVSESEAGRGGWLITANVDYLQRFSSDPETAAVYTKASHIVADGVPLLWAARLLGTPLPDRVAGSDLVWLVAEAAARRRRSLYLLGGNPGAAEAAAALLRARWPQLAIAGHSSPFFSNPPTPAQIEPVRAELALRAPDIVYVALGAPKEELVIAALHERFPRTWWIGVGISLSFMSGEVRRAPVWMQRAGLEWLHRMWQEPRRLGPRYLARNLPFVAKLLTSSALARLGR
ncbi:MAG TPA: WecB/TagA/CpsF family glycosyltransferase [Myxococcota bacterium]|nr:WecB/TagA/CpsF family glycosyltransferase [Myxococcota bacterium]